MVPTIPRHANEIMQGVDDPPADSFTKLYKYMGTKNQFTTLVSVRLDNEVVESLEKVVKRSKYRNRSATINNLLKGILNHTDDHDIEYMISKGIWSFSKWKVKIERS